MLKAGFDCGVFCECPVFNRLIGILLELGWGSLSLWMARSSTPDRLARIAGSGSHVARADQLPLNAHPADFDARRDEIEPILREAHGDEAALLMRYADGGVRHFRMTAA